jgi:hypothetical protein
MKSSFPGVSCEAVELFLGTRRTQCKLAHEQLGLIGIHRLKSHGRRKIIVIRAIPHQEKIAASFRRHETCRTALVPGWETHKGLPVGTKMMFTGIHRDIEIGIAVGGSDPSAREQNSFMGF